MLIQGRVIGLVILISSFILYQWMMGKAKQEGFEVTVSLKDRNPCLGILGTKIPSDTDCRVISYEELHVEDYDVLVLPGGAKCMEKLRQEQVVLDFISEWNSKGKIIASIWGSTVWKKTQWMVS